MNATILARPSLDTWQQIDNFPARFTLETTTGDSGPLGGAPDAPDYRATDRLLARDRAKVSLIAAIAASADARAVPGTPGAIAQAAELEAMGRRMVGCREVAAFQDTACGGYVCRPKSCHVRLCPDCERSRSRRLVDKLIEVILDFLRPVFWTFTIPNVPPGELAAGVAVLTDAFRRLRRTPPFRGGRCRAGCTHAAVRSGVGSVEITWSVERQSWHPHLHALMDAPWIRWAEARDYWRSATCDAWRAYEWHRAGGKGRTPTRCTHPVDERGLAVAPCHGASVLWVETVRGAPGSDAWRGAIVETLKYVTKGLLDRDGKLAEGVAPDQLGELLLALRRRRLVVGWGELRGIRDQAEDDLRNPDDYLTLAETGGVPELVGLPRICPLCNLPGAWAYPIDLPRRACRPLAGGRLVWIPPPAAPA